MNKGIPGARSGGGKVKSIVYYLKDAIKFYDTENPWVARILFVVMLGIIFGSYWLTSPFTQTFFENAKSFSTYMKENGVAAIGPSMLSVQPYLDMLRPLLMVMLILGGVQVLNYFIGMVYGTYYYSGLTHPETSLRERLMLFVSRLPKLIVFNILFYLAFGVAIGAYVIITALLTMLFPLFAVLILMSSVLILIVSALFVFKDYLIIEFNPSLKLNLRKTLDITKNSKKNIIINVTWPICIQWLLSGLIADVGDAVLAMFIASFLEAVLQLIRQRLVVLMFMDAACMERKDIRHDPEEWSE